MEVTESRRKSKKDDDEQEDRISKLPQVLQHHILSFLSTAESARTSVLSKTWFHSWSTNPDLHLDHSLFRKKQIELSGPSNYYPTLEDETRKFQTYVNKTLTRYQQQKIAVQSLSLSVKILDSKFASKVEDWVRIAINMATSPHLHINITDYLSFPPSRALVVQLLLGSHLLRSLTLTGLGSMLQPSLFSNATIKCKSLKILELHSVVIKETEIESLLSCCPCIEMISLQLCTGFKRIYVANLCCLEKFIVEVAKNDTLMVEIDAPKLKFFHYKGNWRKPGVVKIKPTQYLEDLHLSGTLITNRDFKNLSSNFPCLKYLGIERPQGLTRIDLSSPSLEKVKITIDLDRGQIKGEIDAPGLHSFRYIGSIPSITFSKNTNPKSGILFTCPSNGFDASFFIDLRDSALKQKLSTVSVSLLDEPIGDVDLDELSGVKGASTLAVKELHLVTRSLSSNEHHIKILLGIFQPKFFHVHCFEDDTDAEIFLCELLIEHRVNDLDCCVSNQVKCWEHNLRELEIESFVKNENVKGFVAWKFKLHDLRNNNYRSN